VAHTRSPDKIVPVSDALARIRDGDTVMVGGFGQAGTPLYLLEHLANTEITDLRIISNNLGEQGIGLGKLLLNGQISHAFGSFFTNNPDAVAAANSGKIDVTLLPQGTLAEAIRAGGAGIAAFFTPTAANTLLSEGKESREFNGRTFVLEEALTGDVALIKAETADELGNLVFRKSARNFNPIMAMAARTVIVEVSEIVSTGELSPETIVTPHIFVDYLVEVGNA
jgi:3-oxoacid CoA-transferase subunit A